MILCYRVLGLFVLFFVVILMLDAIILLIFKDNFEGFFSNSTPCI